MKKQLACCYSFYDANDYKTKIFISHYENGEKVENIIHDPVLTFSVTKEEHLQMHEDHPEFIVMDIDKTYEVTVPFNDLYNEIINIQEKYEPEKAQANRKFLVECIKNKKKSHLATLFQIPYIHGADVDIADHYIDRFMEENKEFIEAGNKHVKRCYWDIENDTSETGFSPPQEALAPINSIQFFDAKKREMFLYILSDKGIGKENPSYKKFISKVADFEKEVIEMTVIFKKDKDGEFILDENGDKIIEYDGLKPVIYEFDHELDLISAFFEDVNEVYKPDYMMAWNHTYDILTTINRIKTLGASPEEIICPDHMPYKKAFYKEDESAKVPVKAHHMCIIMVPYIFVDQQWVYMKIREAGNKKESWALNFITNDEELDVVKFDITDNDIRTLPYEDYTKFMKYSTLDPFVLDVLDKKTYDFDLFYELMLLTRTRFLKVLTKTISLRNYGDRYYKDNMGWLLSNNANAVKRKVEKFKQAIIDYDLLVDEATGEVIDEREGSEEKKAKFRGALTYKRTLNSVNCLETPNV